jgi:DNA-binding MarR family transcriptional regulator
MSGAETKNAADRIHTAAIHLLRTVSAEDGQTGLSPARLSALSVLVNAGRCTVGELAAAEHVRSPTMTALVNALEADGLVRRTRHPTDARAVQVEATAKGRRVLQHGRERRLDHIAQLFAGLSQTDVRTIGRAGDLIERALGAANANAAPTAPSRASRPGSRAKAGRGRSRGASSRG